ncbi:hypothetical protein MTBBW1_2720002 [Desulfamplus magnetovallimortis]|uniref:Uncharacterized protein n=1 Tax=Desulfamplus magnetovallimortis TaxID=1246637 RepID=A0A1W1HFH1_9BACT|nr:hypothetical protein [Desulfamplus magnetovallimortis]SLM31125.1 hypothetical protein MTBBW1_2720002 [Desulfamplus magnetovallimortis]
MTRDDIKAYTEIMTGLADNYNKALTPSGLRMRYEALKEYSIDQVRDAATTLLKTHRFNSMPTVGDFVAIIDQAEGKISVDDKAEIEVGKVLDHLQRFGSTVTPKFDDTVTRHLMSTRWPYSSWARYVKENDLQWWKRDFVRSYQAHAAGIDAGVIPLPSSARLDCIRKLAETTFKSIPVHGGAYA